jgi:hypothetical protein
MLKVDISGTRAAACVICLKIRLASLCIIRIIRMICITLAIPPPASLCPTSKALDLELAAIACSPPSHCDRCHCCDSQAPRPAVLCAPRLTVLAPCPPGPRLATPGCCLSFSESIHCLVACRSAIWSDEAEGNWGRGGSGRRWLCD